MSAPIDYRIEQIFIEAEAMRPENRGAFLERACANDRQMRREVEALLAAAAACEEYFEDLSARLTETWKVMKMVVQKRR